MLKTLGGDRLGSGKKMKVELHNYERSTHNLSYLWRSTMSAGTLVPFMSKLAMPADTFDINLNCDVKTLPTVGPLFGSFKVQLDVFVAPIRLYNAALHNNTLGIGMNMSQIKLPALTLTAPSEIGTDFPKDLDNSQINPSCILSYLGIRGIGNTGAHGAQNRSFNGVPLLAYWEIYKQYYSNKQELFGAVVHTPQTTIETTVDTIKIDTTTISQAPTVSPYVLNSTSQILKITSLITNAIPSQIIINTLEHGRVSMQDLGITFTTVGLVQTANYNFARWGTTTVQNWDYINQNDIGNGAIKVWEFPLDNIDQIRKEILADWDLTAPYDIIGSGLQPYTFLNESNDGLYSRMSSQEGLAIKTYQSDLLNNWLQTDWIEGPGGISEITAIDTSGGSFTLDTLLLSRKVYDMLNRIAVSGGSYDDWLDAVYVHEHYTRCESPIYMGGLIKELVFQEIFSNAQTTEQPLGTLAGKGVMSGKHKGGTTIIRVDEPSYIIGIVSLTPRIDYSQGNTWDTGLKTIDDIHKPQLDEIGFQDLITEQMAWWDTTYNGSEWVQKSAGKQPAWINYMTSINEVRGNFAIATNEMFMTLNRRYENNGTDRAISDLTTYIDPSKFNFIFAETALDSQNFKVQIAVDITARRKMSAKIMPNL